MKNILLTGGQGQLAHDICQVLEKKYAVAALTSQELDVTDPKRIRTIMHSMQPEIIVNCAAFTKVDACETSPEKALAVNATGPGYLAEAAARTGAKLIHISTDYVFNGSKKPPAPYSEDDPTGPISSYGRSKLEGEKAIRHAGATHLIIRTAWLYGIQGHNFLKTMLRLALADPSREIKVVNDQFGSLTWSYRLALQIERLLKTDLHGTIHATAEGYCSWYEAALFFLEKMGIPHRIIPCSSAEYQTPARRPINSILENHRLKKLALNLMRPWQEDVAEFVVRHRDQLLQEARLSK